LEGACDALRGTRVWRAGPQRPAAQEHLALLWRIVPGNHVERGGLAAAVGTNQAVHLAGPDLQGKIIDRANAAEAQRHALEREHSGGRVGVAQAPQQLWTRADFAMALKRPPVLEVEHLGNAAGHS